VNDATQALRYLVILEWVLIFASVLIGLSLEETLPAELRAYIDADAERPPSRIESVILALGVVLVAGAVVASIGVYFLRAWARPLYLGCAVAGLLLMLFLGPTIYGAIDGAVSTLTSAVQGAILALLYFSGASAHFQATGTSTPEPKLFSSTAG
jgi:hypothetical protein